MQWLVKHADLLEEPADVLICSANPYLALSGGVGGAFLLRYGDEMQRELQAYLARQGLRYVPRGEVIAMPPCGSPYRQVLHAVGVDAFYDTSAEVVGNTITKALSMATEVSAIKVALAAIGTGYGRLCLADFARGIRPIMRLEFPPIKKVVICQQNADDAETLAGLLG